MKNERTFGGRINLDFHHGKLHAAEVYDSEQLKYAKRMLVTGEEHVYRFHRPWTPLVTKRILDWLLLDKANVMPVLNECVDLSRKQRTGKRRLATRTDGTAPQVKPAELPDALNPEDERYTAQLARLRYVRNVLMAAATGHVVIGRFQYHTDMLGKINALLRPWYGNQWDAMQKVLDERRERYLERLEAEKTEDKYGEG